MWGVDRSRICSQHARPPAVGLEKSTESQRPHPPACHNRWKIVGDEEDLLHRWDRSDEPGKPDALTPAAQFANMRSRFLPRRQFSLLLHTPLVCKSSHLLIEKKGINVEFCRPIEDFKAAILAIEWEGTFNPST